MANEIKWATPASRTTGIVTQAIAAGANYLGSEIDNGTNKDRFITVDLTFTCGSAPTADKTIELYVIYDVTSSDYEEGDATPTDPKKSPVAIFAAKAVTAAQQIVFESIPIAPFAFKLLLKSELDQSASCTLLAYSHNEEVQ